MFASPLFVPLFPIAFFCARPALVCQHYSYFPLLSILVVQTQQALPAPSLDTNLASFFGIELLLLTLFN
jgi:hypothetical protein